MNIKIKLSELLPNPFRNLEHYKIDEEKVEALVSSYKNSGYWPIIIARRNRQGQYESAYAEHRKEAYRRLYGPDAEIEVILLSLSDELMLKMMANENGEYWSGNFLVQMETINAVIKGYGTGRIKLSTPDAISHKKALVHRYALANKTLPYTAITVAQFLGWTKPGGRPAEKVVNALAALDLVEKKALKLSHFENLSNKQADALIREVHVAQRRTAGTKSKLVEIVGDKVSKSMRNGEVGHERVREMTNDLSATVVPKALPPDYDFINHLCRGISDLIDPNFDKARTEKIQAVIDSRKELKPRQVERVANALVALSERCMAYASKLSPVLREKPARHGRMALPER